MFWMPVLQNGDLWEFKSGQRVIMEDTMTFFSGSVLPDEKIKYLSI